MRRGDIGVRSLQDWAAARRAGDAAGDGAYDVLFDHVPDPDRPRAGAPRSAFRAIRAARGRCTGLLGGRVAGGRAGARRWA